jgi:hypothetical protein
MVEKKIVNVNYYRSWFGIIHKCTIIGHETFYPIICDTYTRYLIKIESNGKLKYVHEKRIVSGKEEVYDI